MRNLIVVGVLSGCAVGLASGDVCVGSTQKLVASDANTGALFGVDVDLDGTTLVVGASDNGSSVDNGGAVYVFVDSGSGWVETNMLESTDLDASDFVGFSVSVDGGTIAAGAWGDDELGSLSGAVYVFERDFGGAGNWGQFAKLNAPGASASDVFGFDVAVSGDTLVVGAPLDNGTLVDQGSASVYRRDRDNGGSWVFVTQLFAPDAGVDAQFGSSVALDGDTLVVGAIGDDEMGNGAGAAYVFERDLGGADAWGMRTKLVATTSGGGSQANDQFGYQVGIDQDRVVVGATKRDLNGVFAGAAYVFGRDVNGADSWGQEAELIPSDAQSGQWFGNSVSVSGDRIVVGALNTTTGLDEDQAGQAYVFERDGGGVWNEALILTNEDRAMGDLFGSSVVMDGDTVAVGARLDSEAGIDGGTVSVVAVDDCSGCPADFTGDGSLDIFDVFAFLDAFNTMNPAADFTGDGSFDIFDVFGFLDAFNAGCP